MVRIPFQIETFVAVAAGSAILIAGSGCGASAETRAMGTNVYRQVFPSATEVIEKPMDDEGESAWRPGKGTISEIRGSSYLLGYLVEMQVAGRSGPFSIAVVLDEQLVVKRATVVSYPWSRGREVGRTSFARQFEGKGREDAIEIGKDIDAVTGATISCRAMARGVRDAVRLLAE